MNAIMHRMNWDDLRFFYAIACAGSIRGAATKMRVNHSTVLRRISAFEEKIGVRLFTLIPHVHEQFAQTMPFSLALYRTGNLQSAAVLIDYCRTGLADEKAYRAIFQLPSLCF